MKISITLSPSNKIIYGQEDQTLLEALRTAGISIDAPCGGNGTCGKCLVSVDGKDELCCSYRLEQDITVTLPGEQDIRILEQTESDKVQADGQNEYVIAYDVGTTTVVAFLMDGRTGEVLSHSSALNPQSSYGADVISRIEYEMANHDERLKSDIRECLAKLAIEAAKEASLDPAKISLASVVGNTAMHHLLMGLDVSPLVKPPYMPSVREAMVVSADFLPIAQDARLRVLPNIAGFVGADTVGCMEATDFDKLEKLTLLIDIGTNGEMVLGDKNRRIACSTAAGPAFEGMKIHFGMRGASGAIEHVTLSEGSLACKVIGDEKAIGICGSGLLDAVYALLLSGRLDESGRLCPESGGEGWLTVNDQPAFELRDGIFLTQKDIRELQLAKAAIRAGVELMSQKLGCAINDIDQVLLAGAFGSYLSPESACGIGMLPPCLLDRVRPIGNAAGEGSKRCALSEKAFEHSRDLAAGTDFLELASMPEFQDCYVDQLSFEED